MVEASGEAICAPASNDSKESGAGRVQRYVQRWKEITTSEFIIKMISEDYKIQFRCSPMQVAPITSTF